MSARDQIKKRAEIRKKEQENRLRIAEELSDGRNNELTGKGVNTNPGLSARRPDNKTQILRLLAPASRSTVEFRLADVDTEKCVSHPANRRNQQMLRPSNPKVIEIKDRILEVGGVIEPVKAVLGNPSDDRYQLLDGSTRRYALSLANEEMRRQALDFINNSFVDINELDKKDLEEQVQNYFKANGYEPKLPMLLAANCTLEDAAAFARTANEARSNESYWELAQAIERYKRANQTIDHTQERIGKALGISRLKVTRALPFTEIPEEIIKLFDSPDSLSESVAKYLIKTVLNTPAVAGDYKVILDNVFPKDGVYTSATQFKNDLNIFLASLVNKGGRPRSGVNYKGFAHEGVCGVKITQNRSNSHKFKIDVTVDDIVKLKRLEKLLLEWSS